MELTILYSIYCVVMYQYDIGENFLMKRGKRDFLIDMPKFGTQVVKAELQKNAFHLASKCAVLSRGSVAILVRRRTGMLLVPGSIGGSIRKQIVRNSDSTSPFLLAKITWSLTTFKKISMMVIVCHLIQRHNYHA